MSNEADTTGTHATAAARIAAGIAEGCSTTAILEHLMPLHCPLLRHLALDDRYKAVLKWLDEVEGT